MILKGSVPRLSLYIVAYKLHPKTGGGRGKLGSGTFRFCALYDFAFFAASRATLLLPHAKARRREEKDDAKEVQKGLECGVGLANFYEKGVPRNPVVLSGP